MELLHAIFGRAGHLGPLQECVRAILVFAYGWALVRFAGRRVFGKWAALDIVVSIIVGSNLSRTLTGNAPLVGTIAATTLIMALHWVLAKTAARFTPVSHLVEGRAQELGREGELDAAALRRHAVSEADMNEALRQAGLEDPAPARSITLEPSGKITVLKG